MAAPRRCSSCASMLEVSLLTRQPPRASIGSSTMLQARSPLALASRERTSSASSGCRCTRTCRATTGSRPTVSRTTATISSGCVLSSRRTMCRAIAPASSASWRCTCWSRSASGRVIRSRIDCSCCTRRSASAAAARASCCAATRPASRPCACPCSHASRSMAVRFSGRRRPGSTWPPSAGSCQVSASDIGLPALAAELHAALLGHLARGHQDFFLRGLDLGEPYRAAGLQVVLHHLCGTLRHVLEYLFLDAIVGRLERDDQLVSRYLAQQLLHAAIVHFHQVFEHEHQILQLLAECLIGLGNLPHDRALLGTADQVQDFRRGLRAAEAGGIAGRPGGGKLLLEHLIELAEGSGMHAIERGDPHQDVGAILLGELRDHLRGLV